MENWQVGKTQPSCHVSRVVVAKASSLGLRLLVAIGAARGLAEPEQRQESHIRRVWG